MRYQVFSITPMNYSMPDAGDDAQRPVPELSDWSALGNDVHILTQSLGGGRQDARGATSSEVDPLPPSLGLTFMTKHELARMYFPTKTYGAALQALRRVFLRNPTLMARLERKGYKKTHQFLSPAQLALVFDELGRP